MKIVTASTSFEHNIKLGEIAKLVLGKKQECTGGKADNMSEEDIAKLHKVDLKIIKEQIKIGMDIEKEHVGNDSEKTKKIAMDHLVENPYYYNLLKFMEKVGEESLDEKLPSDICPFAYHMAKKYIESTKDNWNYITPEELHKDIKNKDIYLLDVRKPEDYKEEHIKGAENIFWLDLFKVENLKKLPRDKKIVVYCYVGHTSSQVIVLLRLLGFEVIGLKFGMGISPVEGVPVAGWKDFGFETI